MLGRIVAEVDNTESMVQRVLQRDALLLPPAPKVEIEGVYGWGFIFGDGPGARCSYWSGLSGLDFGTLDIIPLVWPVAYLPACSTYYCRALSMHEDGRLHGNRLFLHATPRKDHANGLFSLDVPMYMCSILLHSAYICSVCDREVTEAPVPPLTQ